MSSGPRFSPAGSGGSPGPPAPLVPLSNLLIVDRGTGVPVLAQNGAESAPFSTISAALALVVGSGWVVQATAGYYTTEGHMLLGSMLLQSLTDVQSTVLLASLEVAPGGGLITDGVAVSGATTVPAGQSAELRNGVFLGTIAGDGIVKLIDSMSVGGVTCAQFWAVASTLIGDIACSGTSVRLERCDMGPPMVVTFTGAPGVLQIDDYTFEQWLALGCTVVNGTIDGPESLPALPDAPTVASLAGPNYAHVPHGTPVYVTADNSIWHSVPVGKGSQAGTGNAWQSQPMFGAPHWYALVPDYSGSGILPLYLANPLAPSRAPEVTVGINNPAALAVSHDGRFALVPNSGAGTTTPVDLTQPLFPILHTAVGGTNSPQGIAIANDDSFALVTFLNAGGGVQPLDLAIPLAPIAQPTVALGGGNPIGIAIAASRAFALVAHSASNNVTPLDLANPLAPVAHPDLNVGGFQVSIAIAPDDSFAVVLLLNADLFLVLDLATPLVPVIAASIAVGRGPGLEMSSDGLFAITSNSPGDTITMIDLAVPFAPVAQAPTALSAAFNPSGVALSPDRTFGMVLGQSGKIQMLDLTNPLAPVLPPSMNIFGTFVPFGVSPKMIFQR